MTITDTALKTKPPTVGGHQTKKQSDYRQWRDDVAEILQEKHFYKEAERWDYCDNSPRYVIDRNKVEIPPSAETAWVCSASSEHDAVLFSSSCDFRICPDCAPNHTARLMRDYVPVIADLLTKYPKLRLRTLTFTRSISLEHSNFKEIAQKGFKLIQKAMYKVVGPDWNKAGAGLLVNWEVGPNGLKLHYHAIYFGPWVDQARLSDAWKLLTGGDYRVWVSAVKHNDGDWQGAVIECLKYATKFYKEDPETKERVFLDPELTVKLFIALKGTRRIRSYGSLYSIVRKSKTDFLCEDCGAKMINIRIEYFQIWRETGFTPEGWKDAIRDSLLLLRTANKSPPKQTETDKPDLPQARMLPVLDKIPIKRPTHYDYE